MHSIQVHTGEETGKDNLTDTISLRHDWDTKPNGEDQSPKQAGVRLTLEQAELFLIDQWQEIWYHEPEPQLRLTPRWPTPSAARWRRRPTVWRRRGRTASTSSTRSARRCLSTPASLPTCTSPPRSCSTGRSVCFLTIRQVWHGHQTIRAPLCRVVICYNQNIHQNTQSRATHISVPQYKPQPSYGSPSPSFEAPLPANQ